MNPKFLILLGAALLVPQARVAAQIRANEAIQIVISGVPQEDQQYVNNTYPVSPSGTINMPFIGVIQATGLSPMALAQRIEAAYKAQQIYNNPTINVLANADPRLSQKRVVVGGYVRRPGPVQFTQGMTIWQAVQEAGGETEFGAVNRVELFRSGKRREINLRDDQGKHIPLQENDSINVPQKNWLGQ